MMGSDQIPCVICYQEHDHRSGDHVCIGNLQDALEAARQSFIEQGCATAKLQIELEAAQAEIERLIRLLNEGISVTDGLTDDSYLEPEHRACMVQWRDDIKALAATGEKDNDSD